MVDPLKLSFNIGQSLEAERLALRFGFEIDNKTKPAFILHWNGEQLSLRQHSGMELATDFQQGALGHRVRRDVQHEKITKAVAYKASAPPRVLDVTAGLGKDAFILARLGCKLHCVERSAALVALLEDGLRRANLQSSLAPACARIHLQHADSFAILATLAADAYDVIYLDPMFPKRQKSALVKKDMQLLQGLLEPEDEAQALLHAALKTGVKRVVLKRPRLSPTLEPACTYTIEGKRNRFDIYLS